MKYAWMEDNGIYTKGIGRTDSLKKRDQEVIRKLSFILYATFFRVT